MFRRVFSLSTNSFVKETVSNIRENLKIKSWQIHSYGDLCELTLNSSRLPIIKSPNDVLVQVSAASVNPIDLFMLGGYGRTLFQIQRKFELEFPLILGRDFSGTVIAKGHGVGDQINVGDEVYGFIPIHKQGSFSQITLAEKCHVLRKPKHLNHMESASLVYTTMTAWSALFIFGNLLLRQRNGLRILIMGASGGVGTSAIQLLKSQGCTVHCTCSNNAVKMVENLGADLVFDYTDKCFENNVEQQGRYDIILDGAKIGYQNIPGSWKYDTYITLNSPLLINTDSYGLLAGLTYSVNNLLDANVSRIQNGSTVKWGFFVPSRKGFEFINELICSNKIKSVIHKTFNFEELPDAFKSLSEGHLRGKVVINFNSV